MSRVIDLEIPEKLLPVLTERKRYKSIRGGRGSGKSHTVARGLLALGASRPGFRVACCREVQKSIEGSVKRLLDDLIAHYELHDYFESQRTKIITALGGEFTFHGLREHNSDAIKSLEGCHVAWLEEAQRISERSWQILTPTMRMEESEIWATWNPELESDPVYQRTFKSPWVPAEKMLDIEINWRDNPFYNDVLEDERQQLKRMNEDLYQHIWEGKLRTMAGLLFKRVWFKRYKPADLIDPDTGQQREMTRFLATDYATTAIEDPDVKTEPDWTELGVWGQDKNSELWALDWWSGQVEPDGEKGWVRAMAELCDKWEVERIFEEKGAIYRATRQAVSRSLRRRGCMAVRTPIASVNSKAERAMGFVALASDLIVHIPDNEWGDRLIEQLCAFTGEKDKTDDMVDVCSILARGLEMMGTPEETDKPKRRIVRPFTEAHTFGIGLDDDMDDERGRYGEA